MAIQSRLEPLLEELQSKALQYGVQGFMSYQRNYTNIQRGLRASFIAYVMYSMYNGFNPQPKKKAKKAGEAESLSASEQAARSARSSPEEKAAQAALDASVDTGGKGGRKGKGKGGQRAPRVAVDAVFFERLRRIMRIVIPSAKSKTAGLLILHTFFLVLRTMLSLYVADLDGRIVAALVRRKKEDFLRGIAWWMAVAVPATYTNSMIEYLQSKIALSYRTSLTKRVQEAYLTDMTFYKLGNLDDRIRNADQLITVDVAKFSNSLAEMYSNLAKPTLDVILYSFQLSRNVGGEALILMTILVNGSALLLRKLTPPFGQYAATEQQLEGEFRFYHSRLIENAEEVAFYRGQKYEQNVIERAYFSLIKHVNRIYRIRIGHGMMEEGIIKWLWGSIGVSFPSFFFGKLKRLIVECTCAARRVCSSRLPPIARHARRWRQPRLADRILRHESTSSAQQLGRLWTYHVLLQGALRTGRLHCARLAAARYHGCRQSWQIREEARQ